MSKNKHRYLTFEEKFKDIKQLSNSKLFDEQLEKRILAAIIAFDEFQLYAIDFLTPEMFFALENRQLFNLIINIRSSHSSIENLYYNYNELVNYLAQHLNDPAYSELEVEYINEVSSMLFNQNNFYNELSQLAELNRMRNLEGFFQSYLANLTTKANLNSDTIINDFDSYLRYKTKNQLDNSGFVSTEEAFNDYNLNINKIMSSDNDDFGLLTGFPSIDKYIQGLKGGQFVILAARPGVGKTALALNIATNVAYWSHVNDQKPEKRYKNVAFISLEMPVHELLQRVISSVVRVPLSLLQKPKQLLQDLTNVQKINYFATEVSKINIYYDDSATSRINDLTRKLKALAKNLDGELDLIIIDYLQLIATSEAVGNRQNEISTISRSLKTLALELKIPIIALSQLSRNVESREDKRPQLHDLRESGAIEQDADIVIMLHRDVLNLKKYESSDTTRPFEAGNSSLTHVTIAKNRNGQPGSTQLVYEGATVTFLDDPSIQKFSN